jgi:hypothetical protein
MNQILESRNYGMFELLDFNRDVGKTDKLEASMKAHGFLAPCPRKFKHNVSHNYYGSPTRTRGQFTTCRA